MDGEDLGFVGHVIRVDSDCNPIGGVVIMRGIESSRIRRRHDEVFGSKADCCHGDNGAGAEKQTGMKINGSRRHFFDYRMQREYAVVFAIDLYGSG